jgi:hypothetical protein
MAEIEIVEIDLDEMDLTPEQRKLLEDAISSEPIDWEKVLTQQKIDEALAAAGLVTVN